VCALARFTKRFLRLVHEQLYPQLPGPEGGCALSVLAVMHLAQSLRSRLSHLGAACGVVPIADGPRSRLRAGRLLDDLYNSARSAVGLPHEVSGMLVYPLSVLVPS
jgi:hypothetical protein